MNKCTVVYNHDIVCDSDEDEPIHPDDINAVNAAWLVPGYQLDTRPDGTAGTCNEHMELMGEP